MEPAETCHAPSRGWYFASEDEPPTGPYPTRRDAFNACAGAPVLARHTYGSGDYEYLVGYPGEDSADAWYIFRHDTAMADQANWAELRTPAEWGAA